MTEIKDKLAGIARKQAQAVELRQQLERSLALEELWPGVFDADARVTAHWAHDHTIGTTFTIKRTTQAISTRVFPLEQIPEALHATMPTQIVVRLQEQQRKQAMIARMKGVVACSGS